MSVIVVLRTRPNIETRDRTVEDKVLQGLLRLGSCMLRNTDPITCADVVFK